MRYLDYKGVSAESPYIMSIYDKESSSRRAYQDPMDVLRSRPYYLHFLQTRRGSGSASYPLYCPSRQTVVLLPAEARLPAVWLPPFWQFTRRFTVLTWIPLRVGKELATAKKGNRTSVAADILL